MFISFQRETSGTTLGGDKPLSRSHMREWGHSPRNYKTQCSAAYEPLHGSVQPSFPFVRTLLKLSQIAQSAFDIFTGFVWIALGLLFLCATAASIGVFLFLMFCSF